MTRKTKILGMMIAVLAVFTIASDAMAESYPFGGGSMSRDDCYVRDARWSARAKSGNRMTLPLAMKYANAYNPKEIACRKNVYLEVPHIQITTPLRIIGGGASDAPFTLSSNDATGSSG